LARHAGTAPIPLGSSLVIYFMVGAVILRGTLL